MKKHGAKIPICETNEFFQIVKQSQTGTNLYLDYVSFPFWTPHSRQAKLHLNFLLATSIHTSLYKCHCWFWSITKEDIKWSNYIWNKILFLMLHPAFWSVLCQQHCWTQYFFINLLFPLPSFTPKTSLCLKWVINEDLLDSTGNSAQCYIAAWMGGVSGENGMCICMAESLHCPPETMTTLFVNWPYPNTKYKVKKSRNISILNFDSESPPLFLSCFR